MGLLDWFYRGVRPKIELQPIDEETAVSTSTTARIIAMQGDRQMRSAKRLQALSEQLAKTVGK